VGRLAEEGFGGRHGPDRGRVREVGLVGGLVDNKVCAVDETWSGLRFVFRLKDRPKTPARRQ